MTQFAALPADAVSIARGATVAPDYVEMQAEMRRNARIQRQQTLDAIIDARTAAGVNRQYLEQRIRPRLKVGELSQMSDDAIRRHNAPVTATDTRGPAIRFLDVLDLPRNAIANLAFGQPGLTQWGAGLAGTAGLGAAIGAFGGPAGALVGAGIGAGIYGIGSAVAGITRLFTDDDDRTVLIRGARTGSFGRPAIYFSEVLERLGVENRVIRAAVGFFGDVMMDPLTYLSGGGNAAVKRGLVGAVLPHVADASKVAEKVGVRGTYALRMTLQKQGIKMADDWYDEVARLNAGRAPTAPLALPEGDLAIFNSMLVDGIKVGDEVIQASAIDHAMLKAREMFAQGTLSGREFRQVRKQVTDKLYDNIAAYGAAMPHQSQVADVRRLAAQEYLRRFSAKSNHQFTFPLSGVSSNFWRKELGYRTLDIPVGRFGREGKLHKFLGKSEDEFAARTGKEIDEAASYLREQRFAAAGGEGVSLVSVAPDIANIADLPDDLRSVAKLRDDGSIYFDVADLSRPQRQLMLTDPNRFTFESVRFAPESLDAANRGLLALDASKREHAFMENIGNLERAEADIVKAEDELRVVVDQMEQSAALSEARLKPHMDAVKEAERRATTYQEQLGLIAGTNTEAFIDSLNLLHGSTNVNDALSSLNGPAGMIRRYWPKQGNIRYEELRREKSIVDEMYGYERQMLKLRQQDFIERLADITPGGRRVDEGATATTPGASLAREVSLTMAHREDVYRRIADEMEDAYVRVAQGDPAPPPVPDSLAREIEATLNMGRRVDEPAMAKEVHRYKVLRNPSALPEPDRVALHRMIEDSIGIKVSDEEMEALLIHKKQRDLQQIEHVNAVIRRAEQEVMVTGGRDIARGETGTRPARGMREAEFNRRMSAARATFRKQSRAGKVDPIDISFPDDIDRLVWIATERLGHTADPLQKARQARAMELAVITYGKSDRKIRAIGAGMRTDIDKRIAGLTERRLTYTTPIGDVVTVKTPSGKPGASVGSIRAGRELVFGQTEMAARRRDRVADPGVGELYRQGEIMRRMVDELSGIGIDIEDTDELENLINVFSIARKEQTKEQVAYVKAMLDDLGLEAKDFRQIVNDVKKGLEPRGMSPFGDIVQASRLAAESASRERQVADALINDIGDVSKSLQANESAAGTRQRELSVAIKEMEKGWYYRVAVDGSRSIQDSIRNISMIGLKHKLQIAPVTNFQRAMREGIPLDKEQALREYLNDLKVLNKEIGADAMGDVNTAVMAKMALMAGDGDFEAAGFKTGHYFDASGNKHAHDPFVEEIFPKLRDDPKYAMDDGKHALLDHPKVVAMAQRWSRTNKEMYLTEHAHGLWNDMDPSMANPAYIRIQHSLQAEEDLRILRNVLDESIARDKRLPQVESAMMARSTRRYYYTLTDDAGRVIRNPDGSVAQKYVYAGMWGRKIEELSDTQRLQMAEFQSYRRDVLIEHGWKIEELSDGHPWSFRAINDGDATMPDRWEMIGDDPMPRPFNTSPYALNADKEAFRGAVPRSVTGEDLFEENFLTLIASRQNQHGRALAGRTFRENVMGVARYLTDEQVAGMEKTRGGVVMVPNSRGVPEPYRKVNTQAIQESMFEEFHDLIDESAFVPEPLAAAIEDYFKPLKDQKNIGSILKVIDKLHSWWKQTALLHPSWWSFNMIGGAINSSVGADARITHMPKWWSMLHDPILRMHGLKGDGIISTSKLIEINGQVWTHRELMQEMARRGVVGAGRTFVEIESMVATGSEAGKTLVEVMKGHKAHVNIYKKWFEANAATDDMWRAATFVDLLDQGYDIEEATLKTIKALFDYHDLSSFEQKVGVRVWPFFRWMRNNVALQAKLLLDKPAWAASFPKLQNALEEAFVDEERIPMALRPRWMRETLAAQIGANPSAKFVMLGSATPIQELYETGQALMGADGFLEMLKYFGGSINLVLRMPMELAAHREIFTGRDIGSGTYDVGVLEYFGNQLRPLTVAEDVSKRVGEGNYSSILLRLIIGGRYQSRDKESMERSMHYESSQTIRGIRAKANIAFRAGDYDEADDLANDLVREYRLLFDLGLTNLVPRELRFKFYREAQVGGNIPRVSIRPSAA